MKAINIPDGVVMVERGEVLGAACTFYVGVTRVDRPEGEVLRITLRCNHCEAEHAAEVDELDLASAHFGAVLRGSTPTGVMLGLFVKAVTHVVTVGEQHARDDARAEAAS